MEEKESKKNNIIVSEIKIEKGNLKQKIISSFENARREEGFPEYIFDSISGIRNEEEIKKCEIFINDERINFTYYYDFPKEGNYKIKYIFNKKLNSTNFMFYNCQSLLSLDFTDFNSENVVDMQWMFYNCRALKSLDLSNLKTGNVTNMESMFRGCDSLKKLDLSNLNTKYVNNMGFMFLDCKSLISLDLSNFDTQNVTNMFAMFYNCFSLISLDLNFNIKNVSSMEYMFFDCNSLIFKKFNQYII